MEPWGKGQVYFQCQITGKDLLFLSYWYWWLRCNSLPRCTFVEDKHTHAQQTTASILNYTNIHMLHRIYIRIIRRINKKRAAARSALVCTASIAIRIHVLSIIDCQCIAAVRRCYRRLCHLSLSPVFRSLVCLIRRSRLLGVVHISRFQPHFDYTAYLIIVASHF